MSNIAQAIPAINNFNSGIELSAKETQTLDAAMKSASFDRYIEGLNGSSASLGGYIKYMATAEAGTLALSAAQKVAAIAAGVLKAALNGIIVLGIVELVQFIGQQIYNAANKVEIQKKAVEDLSTAYDTSKQKITDINTQLSDTQKKIDDLNSKKKLTFVEQDQLKTLQETTKQLQIQADIAQKQSDEKARELGEASLQSYNNQFGGQKFNQSDIDQYVKNASSTGNNAILMSDPSNIEQMIAAYKQFTDLKSKAFSAKDNDEVERYNKLLTNIKDSLNGDVSSLQTVQTALEKVPIADRTEEEKNALASISKAIDLVYQNIDPSKLKTINFNSVFDDSKLKDVTNQLSILAQQGKLTAETFNQPQFQQIAKAFSAAGISALDASNQINALTKATSNNDSVAKTSAQSNEQLSQTLKDLADSNIKNYQTLQTVLEDVSKYKTLSSDNLNSILKIFPDTASSILEYNSGLKSTASMVDLIKQKMQSLQDGYTKVVQQELENNATFYNDTISKHTDITNQLLRLYGIDYHNYSTYDQLKDAINNAILQNRIGNEAITGQQLAAQYLANVQNYSQYETAKGNITNQILTGIQNMNAAQISKLAAVYGVDVSNFANTQQGKVVVAGEIANRIAQIYGAINGGFASSMQSQLSSMESEKASLESELNSNASATQKASIASQLSGLDRQISQYQSLVKGMSGDTSALQSKISGITSAVKVSIPSTTSALKSADAAATKAAKAGESVAKKAEEAAKKAQEALKKQYDSQLKIIEANEREGKYGESKINYYRVLLDLWNKYKNTSLDIDDKTELQEKIFDAQKDYKQQNLDESYKELESRQKLGIVQENSKATLQNLLEIQRMLNSSGMSLVDTKDNQLEIEEKIYEVEKAMQEQDKSNIESLLTTTEDMLKKNFDTEKQQHQDRLDQIKKEEQAEKDKNDAALQAIKDQISLQQKQLEQEQNAHNHSEEQSAKEKAVSDIQAELVAIQNDNSDSAAAKKLELQDKLVSAQKELSDYEYSYSIDTQKNALSDLQDKYEKEYDAKNKELEKEEKAQEDSIQTEINLIDKASQDEVAIRTQAMELVKNKSQSFYNQLIAYNTQFGDGISSTISKAWDSAYQSLSHYADKQWDVLSVLNQLSQPMKSYSDSSNLVNTKATRNQSSLNSNGTYTVKKNDSMSGIASWFGISLSDLESANNNIKKVSAGQKVNIPHYQNGTDNAQGGLSVLDDGNGLEDVFQPDGKGNYVMLNRGAKVKTAEETNNLTQWSKLNPQDYGSMQLMSQIKDMQNRMSNAQVNNNTPISIDNSITVQGGTVDKDMYNKLQQLANATVTKTLNAIKDIRINTGGVAKSVYNI